MRIPDRFDLGRLKLGSIDLGRIDLGRIRDIGRMDIGRIDPGRAAALGIALALAVLIVGGIVLPVAQAFGDRNRQVAELQEEQKRLFRLASRLPELEGRIEGAGASPAVAEWLLPAKAPNLALADLQNRIKAEIGRNGGSLSRIEGKVIAAADGPFTVLRLDASAMIDQERLQTMLHGLETMRPRIAVEEVRIKTTGRGATRTSREKLAVDLTVSGRLRAPAEGGG